MLKNRFKSIGATVCTAILVTTALTGGVPVSAKQQGVQENVTYNGRTYNYAVESIYTTDDKDKKQNFEETYKNKKLVTVEYEVTDKAVETEVIERTKTETYKDLESNNKSELPQSVTVDDVECRLDNVEFIKQDTEEHVSYKQQLGYSINEPSEYPSTYDYTYTSPVINRKVTVTLPFSHLEKGKEGWIDGFSAKVTLQNIDGEEFDFGGSTYTYSDSDSPSFSEAEYTYLVKKLGYSTKGYRLTSAKWSGKPYEKNGVICRDAICTGQQYGAMYEAVYEDDVVNQELYTATATYTGSKEIETGDTIYTIKATAYYGEKRVKIVTVSIAVLLFIFLVVAILCYISFGKKKNVSHSDPYKSL